MGWGEFFSLASAVTWAVAVILLRRSGESMPPFELNLVKNLLGMALLVPTILWLEGAALPDHTPGEVGIALLSGVLGIAVADTWYLKALNLLGAARTGIVASLYSPFVIVLSALFLGEMLSPVQYGGFLAVLAGILLVTWRRRRREVSDLALRRGAFYGAGAVFLMAVGIVIVKEILETRPFLWTVEIRLVGGVAGMLAVVAVRHGWASLAAEMRRPQPWGSILVGGFLGTYVAMIFWLAGYRLTSASVASVLNETASAWIVLFAWLFLKEPLAPRRIIGLALTMAGVLLMLSG